MSEAGKGGTLCGVCYLSGYCLGSGTTSFQCWGSSSRRLYMNRSGQSGQGEERKVVCLPAHVSCSSKLPFCGSEASSHLHVTFTWVLSRSAVSHSLVGTGVPRIVGNRCIGHTRCGAARLGSGEVSQNPSQGGASGSASGRVNSGLLGQNK